MTKNIFKIFLIITILITLGLSILSYYKYTQTKNYNILNQGQGIIIEIPNGQYMEIKARNDSIYDTSTTQNPFSTYTKIQKNTSLESSLNISNRYLEYVENIGSKRETEIKPIDSNTLELHILTTTGYKYTEDLKYGIQIDYSGETTFEDLGGEILFKDNGCSVMIIKVGGYEYIDYGNNKTIKIAQDYEPELEFRFNMYISCN